MTKEEIIEIARKAGAMFDHITWVERDLLPVFERFANLVAEKEREECAVFAEESFCGCGRSSCIDGDLRAHNIAASIRAREQE